MADAAAGAAGGAGSVLGGIAGYLASQGSENAAANDLQQALQAYQNVNVPTIAEQQWNLAQEQSAGQLTPEQMQAISMGPNALGSLSTAPTAAQQTQLAALQQLGAGGLTAQERQNILSANQQAAGVANSANAATLQAMNARGMGGSGAQLAAQLSNSQNAANMASQQGAATNAQAQNQALQAMSGAGSLAGQMQAQQFGQQAAVGQAQNAINQFNAQNQQQTQGFNVQAANQAQAANLANAQAIGNQNTAIQNQQQAHNTGLYQQQFSDQMSQAQGEAGVYGQQSNFNQGQAANTAAMYSGIGQGAGQVAGAFMSQGGMVGYANGGEIEKPHDSHNLDELIKSFNKFITEEKNQGYANGGEVPTLGMYSYADGGEVDPDYGSLTLPGMGSSINAPASGPSLGAATSPLTANPSFGPNLGASNYGVDPLTDPSLGQSVYGNSPATSSGTAPTAAGSNPAPSVGSDWRQAVNIQMPSGGMNIPAAQMGYSSPSAQNLPSQLTAALAGYAAGGEVGYSGSRMPANPGGSGASWQPTYSDGGLVDKIAELMSKGGNCYAEGGAVMAPNPYSPGVSPNQAGMHPQTMGGGVPMRDSRDQNSSLYSGINASPMHATQRAALDALLDHMMKTGNMGSDVSVPMQKYAQGGIIIPTPTVSRTPIAAAPVGQAPAMSPQEQAQALAILQMLHSPNAGTDGSAVNPSQTNPLVFQGQGYAAGGAVAKAMQHADTPHAGAVARAHLSPKNDAEAIMREYNRGTLYSGSGHKVHDPQQAKAIAMSESGQSKYSMGGSCYSNGGEAQWDFNAGGDVPAKVSPDERYYSPSEARKVANNQVAPKEVGKKVPGKAPVKGDSPKNDIVNANLQRGGVVVPRTVENSGDDDRIMNFVRDTINKKKK